MGPLPHHTIQGTLRQPLKSRVYPTWARGPATKHLASTPPLRPADQPDPSFFTVTMTGDQHSLFGLDARDYNTMMDCFGVPGLPPEGARRLATQVLDVVGLPGTSAPSAEETSLSRLAEGISSIAAGGLIGEVAVPEGSLTPGGSW